MAPISLQSLARPTLGLTRAWRGMVHLHLQPGPDLNQKFRVTIAAKASYVRCYTSQLKFCVPDSNDVQMTQRTLSHAQPYSGTKQLSGQL